MSKVDISTRSKIVYIIHLARGEWLTIRDIRERYFARHNKPVDIATVVKAIDENNHINGNILEETRRMYKTRQPVKCFSIPIPEPAPIPENL